MGWNVVVIALSASIGVLVGAAAMDKLLDLMGVAKADPPAPVPTPVRGSVSDDARRVGAVEEAEGIADGLGALSR